MSIVIAFPIDGKLRTGPPVLNLVYAPYIFIGEANHLFGGLMKHQRLLSQLALTLGLILIVAFAIPSIEAVYASPMSPQICYKAQLEKYGWSQGTKCDGATAGTTGQSLRMEAIQIYTVNRLFGICYRASIQNYGWTGYGCDGATIGSEGASLRMEAIQMTLQHPVAHQHVCYAAYLQNLAWNQGWKCDGATAGTTGQSLRMEAIQINIEYW